MTPESYRWNLLRSIHGGGAIGVTPTMLEAIADACGITEAAQTRDALAYLRGKGLIDYTDAPKVWRYHITARGTDFVDGNTPDIVGIVRPRL